MPAGGLFCFGRSTVVQRASCGVRHQARAACHAAQARLRLDVSVSLGLRRSTRACCARKSCALIVVYPCHREERCAGERPYTAGARLWCDIPMAASNTNPAPTATRRRRAGARCRCLWSGGAALGLAARARRTALIAVFLCHVKEPCAGERPLSSGTRPWCNEPAAASNTKPAPRVTPAHAVSGAEAQHSGLLRARGMCADRGLPVPQRRALRQREALYSGCTTVMRDADCGI